MRGLVPLEHNTDKESNHVKGKEWKNEEQLNIILRQLCPPSVLTNISHVYCILLVHGFPDFCFPLHFPPELYICINGHIIISLFIKLQYIKIRIIDV